MRHLIPLVATASLAGCALIGTTAAAAGAPSRPAHPPSHSLRAAASPATSRAHRRRSSHARTGCLTSAAKSPHQRRRAARTCQARSRRDLRPRPTPSPARNPAGPTAAPAPPANPAPSSAPTAGESRAATIAAVLATPCPNTELTPEAGNLESIRAAILCLINRERAEDGESPLRVSQQLEQAAEGHSRELISADYFAHVSPSGLTPVNRVRQTGYIPGPAAGYVIGENLAWGTYDLATPAAIVAAWIASPPHLANILEGQYRETGIGVVPAVPAALGDGNPGATYAQEFGVITG